MMKGLFGSIALSKFNGWQVTGFLILCAFFSANANAVLFKKGDVVMGECGDIYQKGTIKAIKPNGYVLSFDPKEARPLKCVPYVWKDGFLHRYKPTQSFAIKGHGGFLWIREAHPDLKFQRGEEVGFDFRVERKALPDKKYKLMGVIRDITSDGLIAIEITGGDPKGREEFEKRIGRNYMKLEDHDMFHGEKVRRLGFNDK
ncbi:MAG: hypothetical protein AXA67_01265 [Methylothermaceae bacteria B42]|nr:MAG: hypothetical protein AXA67_01265 [Methylothermaceae bacteria B42]HHJ40508.1 hypothetical protein [Methylothermaceae bacterium]